MAKIFKDYRPRIAGKMAKGDAELKKWLSVAAFAKTSNGYWLAWQGEEPDTVIVLPPPDFKDDKCHWLESWDNDNTIESFIKYVESGEFAEEGGGMVLNLFIEDPETGGWR